MAESGKRGPTDRGEAEPISYDDRNEGQERIEEVHPRVLRHRAQDGRSPRVIDDQPGPQGTNRR